MSARGQNAFSELPRPGSEDAEPAATLARRTESISPRCSKGQKQVSSRSAGIWRTRWFQAPSRGQAHSPGTLLIGNFRREASERAGVCGLQVPPLGATSIYQKGPRVLTIISEAANVTVVISPWSGSMAVGASHPCP